MENFYVQAGWIIPVFHKVYWMGLVSNNSAWPTFRYVDRALPCEWDLACLYASYW